MKISTATITALATAVSALPHEYQTSANSCAPPATVTVTQTVTEAASNGNKWGGNSKSGNKWGENGYNTTTTSYKNGAYTGTATAYGNGQWTGTGTGTAYSTASATEIGPLVNGSQIIQHPPYGSFQEPSVYHVKVGGQNLVYDPPYLSSVKPGDVLVFDFLQKNHTLTESSFDNPCTAIDGGVKSGFLPNPDGIEGKQIFNVTIRDETPHWFYCGQKLPIPHCQQGMVFAVNPPKEGNTFEEFLKKAKAAPTTTSATYATSTASTTTAAKATHTVLVGGKDEAGKPVLRYDPEVVFGNEGDMVHFQFGSMNHTVTESTFESPCTPKNGGFKSGFRPNPANVVGADNTIFEVPITNASVPTWVYCGQKLPKPHCEQGMVFAINPPAEGNTFPKFKQLAAMALESGAATGTAMMTATGMDSTATGTGYGYGYDKGYYTTRSY